MVNEGKAIPRRGKMQIADPAGGLIERFANGIFDVTLTAENVNGGQRTAVGGPVGIFDIVEQIAGSVGADGKLGEGADVGEGIVGDSKAAQDGHLAAGGA